MKKAVVAVSVCTAQIALVSPACADSNAPIFHISADGTCLVFAPTVSLGEDDTVSRAGATPTYSNDAVTYRWVDEDGVVNYGNVVPSEGYEAEAVAERDTDISVKEVLADLSNSDADSQGPPVLTGWSSRSRSTASLKAQARTTDRYVRTLRRQVTSLQAADYVPECEEALRDKIRQTQETLEQQQEKLRYYRTESERIQDQSD